MTEEKLLSFSVYKPRYLGNNGTYDKRYCACAIFGERVSMWQCHRKPKHEYGGHMWCSQHYPPNEEKRRQERHAEWKAKSDAQSARWKAEADERKLKNAALEAIRKIAAGHNDPRSLAQEVLNGEK